MTQFDAYILVTLSVFKTKSLKFAAPGYLSIVFVTAATLTGFSLQNCFGFYNVKHRIFPSFQRDSIPSTVSRDF